MIKLNIGIVIDPEAIEVSDSFLKNAISESRWRPGYATMQGRRVPVERFSMLGDFEYRIGDSIISNASIEAWYPSEWMEWRDN